MNTFELTIWPLPCHFQGVYKNLGKCLGEYVNINQLFTDICAGPKYFGVKIICPKSLSPNQNYSDAVARPCLIRNMKDVFPLPGISHMTWGGHHYFLSWREPWHKFEDWDWFNGRNFCRDRCMDLVSFDTPGEYALFAAIMKKGEENASPRSEGVKPSSLTFQTM